MPKLRPEKSLGYQVRKCHLRFDRLLNAKLSPHKLKAGYWYYLRALWNSNGITQKELSQVTNVTETTMVGMINSMVHSGLVTRSRDKIDKRKMRVILTPHALSLEEPLFKIAKEINQAATGNISPKEIAICISVLSKMSENLKVEFEKK